MRAGPSPSPGLPRSTSRGAWLFSLSDLVVIDVRSKFIVRLHELCCQLGALEEEERTLRYLCAQLKRFVA